MTKCHVKLSLRDLGWVCLSSRNAIALGMTLFMYALANGDVGWVSILPSTAPIMMLPMLWLIFRHSPPAGAWFGTLLTVVGTAVILMKIWRLRQSRQDGWCGLGVHLVGKALVKAQDLRLQLG